MSEPIENHDIPNELSSLTLNKKHLGKISAEVPTLFMHTVFCFTETIKVHDIAHCFLYNSQTYAANYCKFKLTSDIEKKPWPSLSMSVC